MRFDHDGLIYDLQTSNNWDDKSFDEPSTNLHVFQNDFFEFDVDLLGTVPHMATVILETKNQTLASADIELRELA